LLQLDRSGVRVASYLTELPPQAVLRKKLHDALLLARARLDSLPDASAGGPPRRARGRKSQKQ
jgi:hypothetical protein